MHLKGSCRIHVVDSRTGKVKQVVEQENLITNQTLLDVLFWGAESVGLGLEQNFGGNYVLTSTKISISTSTATPVITNSTLSNIIATGYIPSGIVSPIYDSSANPPFGQIQNRIDFTGSDRVFNSVGLTRLSSANSQNTNATAYAYLKLDTPCTQSAFDFLDIFYRIQFLNSGGQGFPPQAIIDFGRSFFGGNSASGSYFNMSILYTSVCKKPEPIFNYINFSYPELISGSYSFTWNDRGFRNVQPTPSGTKINSHFKFKTIYSYGLNDRVGIIFNSMFQGGNSTITYTCSHLQSNDTTPLQNLFSHSADATVPFFDSLKLASGNGKVYLNGTWQNKWPELYKITIVASGVTGTATYKWSVRRHLGFNGNTYSDRSVSCPFRNPNTPAAQGFHGWRDENNDVLRYSSTQIVQYDETGVTLLDLLDGSYQNWDSTTTPPLPVTTARQCAVDLVGKKVYVGCRQTGVWVIDPIANTITNPVTAPVYGVDVGRNGVAFVLTNGALLRSTDWATPLLFTYAGITDGNWSRVQFLKVDPENTNDQLALVITVPNQANRIVWWSVATQTAVNGPQNGNIRRWPAAFDVSDTGSHWACYGVGLPTYGSTAVVGTDRDIPKQSLTHSVYGADTYGKISFYKDLLILNSAMCNKSGTNQKTYTDLGTSAFVLHMDGGIVLTNRAMRHLFTDNGTFTWDDYGWDGTSWQLGQTSGKLTHAGEEPLRNGLTIKFQDGSNAPHFSQGDYYTQGVCYGLLKDNATSIQYQSAWYSVPAQFGFPVQSGLTVPATAPYQITLSAASDPTFIRIETDSPELIQLTINGQPVVTVYVGGTIPPGPMECRVDASGNGVVEFHSSAAGATIGGTYAYLKR